MIPHRIPYNSGDPRFDDTDLYDDKVIILSTLGQGPAGSKGESFKFDDFTQEQLDDLRSEIATVYCRKYEAAYQTNGSNVRTIPIPFDDYNESVDMLFVDIEGLSLAQNVDYTVSGSNIVLMTPITNNNTTVHFKMLTVVAVSESDMEAIGDLFDVDTTVTVDGVNPVTSAGIYSFVMSAIASITDGDGVSY